MATNDGPNPFRDRAPWLQIRFGGTLALAALTKIDGVSTKDKWNEQKSKEKSGVTAVFQGTTKSHPKLTFTATTAEEYDWIGDLWNQLEPKPGQGSGAGTAKTPAQTFAIGSPAKADTSTAPTGQGGVFTTAAPGASASSDSSSSKDNPGPKPPTISVDYPWLRWHGITAVAREEWEGPKFTDGLGVEVTITFVPQDPPVQAGGGAMAPAKPGSQFVAGSAGNPGGGGGGGASGAPTSPADKMDKNAAAGAAGT